MSGLTGAVSGVGGSVGAASSVLSRRQVTADEFLLLLVTQLRHQDPLKPLTSEELLTQLAQFQSLEELMELNGSTDKMLLGSQLTAASGMLGRYVRGISAVDGPLEGVVERVYIDGDDIYLDLGGWYLLVSEVVEVSAAPAADEAGGEVA